MATKADVASVEKVMMRVAVIVLGLWLGGISVAIKGEADTNHKQDVRIVSQEKTGATMETIETRFTSILIEMQSIKGDTRVIVSEMQAFRKQLDDLCRRVERLEENAHMKEGD